MISGDDDAVAVVLGDGHAQDDERPRHEERNGANAAIDERAESVARHERNDGQYIRRRTFKYGQKEKGETHWIRRY